MQKENDYYTLFDSLGIRLNELSPNYNPETYGRELMRGVVKTEEIAYSVSTQPINRAEVNPIVGSVN